MPTSAASAPHFKMDLNMKCLLSIPGEDRVSVIIVVSP